MVFMRRASLRSPNSPLLWRGIAAISDHGCKNVCNRNVRWMPHGPRRLALLHYGSRHVATAMPSRIKSLDSFRFVGALLVVIFHYALYSRVASPPRS